MNRILYNGTNQFMMRIAQIEGGSLRNAIPRESVAVVVLLKSQLDAFKRDFEAWGQTIKEELKFIEPNLDISLLETKLPKQVMGLGAQERLLQAIYTAHNGVYAMSAAIPDLVETSNNVAKVVVKNGEVKIGCLTRSSVDSAKMDLAHALKSAFELGKCDVSFSGTYPGWSPNPNSEALEIAKKKYEELFNEEPKIIACHAGLECGILGQNYPEMDMISFGPTILGAHSPDERVNISSVQKFWKFLLEILKDTPKK